MSTKYYAVPYTPPNIGIELIAMHNGRLPSSFINGLPDNAIEITREQFAIRYMARGDELKLVNGVPTKLTQEEYNVIRDENYFDGEIEKIINKIDTKTQELISQGVEFNNCIFSLSTNAQLNWQRLSEVPVIISTKNNSDYIITDIDELNEFKLIAFTRLEQCLDSGRILKSLVNNAKNSAELSAIIDDRE